MPNTNILNLLSEQTYTEKMDEQNILLAAIASNSGGLSINSWADVQKIVRLGLASKIFKLGDQLLCNRGGKTLTWDIIGFDYDTPTDKLLSHSMTLQLHEFLDITSEFSAKQALYYTDSGLNAGTYSFSITKQPWYPADNNKTFRFTLNSPVPLGSQIVLGGEYNKPLAGTTVSIYNDAKSTTSIQTATISEGSGGTFLGTCDGTVANLNHIQRALAGDNNWSRSCARQYINSAEGIGNVWTPSSVFDRPPSWHSTSVGFLNGLDEDFLSATSEVVKHTTLNTETDGGITIDTADKFFLLSLEEVYGSEGDPYPYYSLYSDLDTPGTSADSNRARAYNGTVGEWALRSPLLTNASHRHVIKSAGNIHTASATIVKGMMLACCIA